MPVITIHIAIGNSDGKLTQRQWSDFHRDVGHAVEAAAGRIHGAWVSPSVSPYQNACWSFDLGEGIPQMRNRLRGWLAELAGRYGQDSVAWNESETEFIEPAEVS